MPSSFDYSSRDFDTIRTDLLARASRVFPEWTDRDSSDFGMLFIDLWASMADVMHYYIDRVAGESFLSTATQRESVMALANLMDYTPRSRSNAQASLTLLNTSSVDVLIPALTEFVARYNNTTYFAYAPQGVMVPATGSVVVSILEGSISNPAESLAPGGASGAPGQRYVLSRAHSTNAIRVFVYEDRVTATEYAQVSKLGLAKRGDRVFGINVTATGDVEVVFGTATSGFVPPNGALITTIYATSNGAAGNLPANTVTGFKAGSWVGVSTGSCSPFTGGVDEESITSLRQSIPSAISAQNRAVTANDFIALATRISGVSKAAITFAPGDLTHNASVTVFAQPFVSDYLTSSASVGVIPTQMQADIVAALQPQALLGVTVRSAPSITWTPVYLAANIYVNERSVSNWVLRDVSAAIDQVFAFDNVSFGQRLTLGDMYRTIINVPGVDYAQITKFNTDNSTGSTAAWAAIQIDYPALGATTPTPKLPKIIHAGLGSDTVTLIMSGGITTS